METQDPALSRGNKSMTTEREVGGQKTKGLAWRGCCLADPPWVNF